MVPFLMVMIIATILFLPQRKVKSIVCGFIRLMVMISKSIFHNIIGVETVVLCFFILSVEILTSVCLDRCGLEKISLRLR